MDRLGVVFRLVGTFLMLFSATLIPPIGVSLYYHDSELSSFITCFGIALMTGFLLWLAFYKANRELRVRDGFLVVTLFWTVLSVFGTIPFILDTAHPLTFTDALFESVSGLTTTGATVLSNLDAIPRSILYYRMQLHFLGGMGIIVLAVAVLPMLGVGGIQLARMETAGPVKDTRLKPRMTQTAKALWSIYVGLAVLCALCYWWAGMTPFDAIGESFSTISTGGFSIHDSSFAFYHSYTIDAIAIVFMLLGATNFGLHFRFLQDFDLNTYFKDSEFATYVGSIIVVTAITVVTLWGVGYFPQHHAAVIQALFTVTSLASTTGFTVDHFTNWPIFLPYLMMFVALVGGCAASTSGGLKIVRVQVLMSLVRRELFHLAHPRAVRQVKVGGQAVNETVLRSVWSFVTAYIAVFILLLLALLATGMGFETAFGAVASCLSNTGAGIGNVASNFFHVNVSGMWILIVAMLLGRLEIFTILILFTTSYWKH